jgi:hypothetical protein
MVVIRQIIFAGLFLALLGLMLMAVNIVRSDLDSAAEREISFWGRAGYTPDVSAIAKAERDIHRALSLWPDQPDYLRVQSRAMMWRAYWTEDDTRAAELESMALDYLAEAAMQRPAHLATWQELSLELARLRTGGELSGQVQQQLQKLALPLESQR